MLWPDIGSSARSSVNYESRRKLFLKSEVNHTHHTLEALVGDIIVEVAKLLRLACFAPTIGCAINFCKWESPFLLPSQSLNVVFSVSGPKRPFTVCIDQLLKMLAGEGDVAFFSAGICHFIY